MKENIKIHEIKKIENILLYSEGTPNIPGKKKKESAVSVN